MSTERRHDIQAFRSFLDEQLAHGGATLTLPEVLDLWEQDNPTAEEVEATHEAIRRGLRTSTPDAFGPRTTPWPNSTAANLPELS